MASRRRAKRIRMLSIKDKCEYSREKRYLLKKIIKDNDKSRSERISAMFSLDAMDRRGSIVKYKNLCRKTGQARGYSRFFGVSRHVILKEASEMNIPGIKVSS